MTPASTGEIGNDCAEKHPKPYPEFEDPTARWVPQAQPPMADSAPPSKVPLAGAAATVETMASGFRRCFQRGLACDPLMKGTTRITAKIDTEGRVIGTQATGAAGLSQGVIDCVASVIASKQFSRPDGGFATLVVPVSFFPQPAAPSPGPAPSAEATPVR